MANQRLSLTRDQFASFLQDFEQIKQFERLFSNTNAMSVSIDDIALSAGNAGASATDALAQIIELSETLNKEPGPVNVSHLSVIETQLAALDVAPPASNGTVTSVAASGGTTGLTFSGSPITTSGTLTIGGTLAVTNGGTGATTAAAAITSLGATTLGGNMFTLTNPSAITFPRFNADNTVSALDAATFRAAIGAGTGTGNVTSVSGTGTVNGITLTGTVTSSGSLALGGTLSGVSLTTQVTGTLPVANGGTGATTLTSGYLLKGNGTTAVSASLVYDSGTNVGIGTVAPARLFDAVYADATVYSTSASNLSAVRVFKNNAAGGAGQHATLGLQVSGNSGSANAVATISAVQEAATSSAASLTFATRSSAGSYAEAMRIDSSSNVGIGTTANASAILDVQSTTKGFRLPNMTTTQKNAIPSPAAGLMVFDTTLSKACVYSGAAWQTITSI